MDESVVVRLYMCIYTHVHVYYSDMKQHHLCARMFNLYTRMEPQVGYFQTRLMAVLVLCIKMCVGVVLTQYDFLTYCSAR